MVMERNKKSLSVALMQLGRVNEHSGLETTSSCSGTYRGWNLLAEFATHLRETLKGRFKKECRWEIGGRPIT